MIALCCAKCWIVQLSEQDHNLSFPQNQRGIYGNIIIYPQSAQKIATMLPPSIEEITLPICIIFVGSSPPSAQWLHEKTKPLTVCGNKVQQALLWLKVHNPLYSHIDINYDVLDKLPENDILPFHINHVLPNNDSDVLTSRYDKNVPPIPSDADIAFQKVVISDVDGHASPNELRAAALNHIQKKKGGYIKIPHDPTTENEFVIPNLFPKIYPTLFPFGLGSFEDHNRKQRVSLKRHVKHLLHLPDRSTVCSKLWDHL
ncbi:hypothetical protein L208DRAFT_1233559 [Tricholoma matsutake]|nr:hypothetical protein L208DRAFT_1233559 [Tricholoma matsutake 945]